MKTRWYALFAALMLVCLFQSFASALTERKTNDGKVTSVTLYRSQALVTRTVSIDEKKGPYEIIVGGLPEHIVENSLFAEGGDRVEIRAVQFRTRAVGTSPRAEVQQLQNEIDGYNDAMQLNRKNAELLQKQTAYLDKLERFVAPTATVELSKGVLDAEALERVTKFSFEQRKEILKQQMALIKEAKQITDKLNLAQRKLSEITTGSSKTVREAILFVQKLDDGAQPVKLNYLVNSCGWSPSYTVHANANAEKVKLEYNSMIYQMTGEEWSDVSLTLSTASPALSASGPGLAPFRVCLSPSQGLQQVSASGGGNMPNLPQKPGAYGQQMIQSQVRLAMSKQKKAIREQRSAVNFRSNVASSWGINDAINQYSRVELAGDPSVVNSLKTEMDELGQEPSLSYKLKTPVSLSSRNSQQMVRIIQTELPSKFYHVATPILSSYVYREAELANDSQEDLLSGPITVYLDGRFVGRSEVPTVARGQSFVVGFGADSQLRARRELADKTSGVNGGNRELKFKYRLVVENYSDKKVPIRLVDRLPTPEDEKAIRVTLDPMDQALSKDKTYTRLERPEGILRWDIEVDAKSTGDQSKMISYGFRIEHDRNYQISLPTSTAQHQKQFEQMQRFRGKK